MSDLNKQQKKASEILSGPVLILAGAGAGKTKTLTERIINLIKNGIDEKSILAVTFTNKAAREMSDRLSKSLGVEAFNSFNPNHPFIGTFHSLGVKIIRENLKLVGLKTKNFDIYDRGDSLRVIKKIIKSEGLNSTNFDPGKILSIISKQKSDGLKSSDLKERANNYFLENLALIWQKYDSYLTKENALDFDDLLGKSLLVLKNHSEIRTHYQNLWHHIHIDEYQDTNKTQYQISKILAEKHQNIFAVGDIDQNIYSWRGADISNILNFEKDYPKATVVLLEQNYRSTKNIISAANQVIVKNKKRKDKNLFTENNEGEKIGLFGAYDEKDEANFITEKSAEIIDKGIKPEEIAVLYRANFQSRALEEAFMASGLPFQVVGTRFFERKEIKDIIAYLKASLNKNSYHLWERIVNAPPRGIGKVTLAKLYSGMEDKMTPAVKEKIANFKLLLEKIATKANSSKVSDTILFILEKTGLREYLEKDGLDGEERLANIKELAVFASRYDNQPSPINLESFLTDVSLQSDQDSLTAKKTGVKLMTIHASKGLEFDTVFITGLEDNLFPHKNNFNNEKTEPKIEEERRLFYVALTRAKRKVILTYAGVRSVFGQKDVTIPSEFIFEIDNNLLENETINPASRENPEKVLYFD